MGAGFRAVCEDLGRLQVRMIRRDGNPAKLAAETIQVILRNRDIVRLQQSDLPYVPLFLRSCGTLLAHTTTDPAYEALECAARLAESYVEGDHGDVNESGTVLRSLVLLSGRRESSAESSGCATPLLVSQIRPLVARSFNNTMEKWQKKQIRPHTSTLLSLLRGSDAVYGENFRFTPVSADIAGLLPIKGKVQMEAKVQKCAHSRCVLRALRDVQLSRLDAGICLGSMADMGFYDAELCNACCEVLFSAHALVTSQQFAQVIYSLGVLQHRHIHQKFFSSMVEFQKCNADAVRQHVVGLAMLRQPPHNERCLMDGIFLHALRPTDPLELNSSSDDATTSPEWFVCVGHALACLGITHFKYRLMVARRLRRCIGSLTTQQRCKMLYSLGDVPVESVPEDLQRSWTGKAVRTIQVLTEQLRHDVDPSDGPFVMNALLAAGVREHPMIPLQPNLESGENPVEVLLRTWATSPMERLLHLTEQIRPHHLGNEPTVTLSHLFTVIASSCGGSRVDSYRFNPLCDAVSSHVGDMNVEETLNTIGAMQCIGIGEPYRNVLVTLLENLWRRRGDMTPESQIRCCRLMESLGHLDIAVELLEYMTSV